ncbi:M24 family metallopeptidase [Sporosalibacterium faouarense]|uniref:M24 family metallopeptidase n=1 Tax=Sporosalibacterium faouarense TaxID=516123 RepID=UPI00141C7AFA|nr:Xaa-Pro peptidase family protein [Sporosalibacterium faouarense]MTI47388.1 aminopeptidase P family protein [Bacillota bacterium]
MNIYKFRLDYVREKMKKEDIDGIVLFPSSNLYYMTGFKTFPEGRLLLAVLPVEGEPFFVAPKLYESQIKKDSYYQEMILWKDEENPYEVLKNTMEEKGIDKSKLAVDDTMWAEQLLHMAEVLPEQEFVPLGNMLNGLRLIKSQEEIEKIQKSSDIVDGVIEELKKYIKPGMTEIEVAAFMEFEMRKRGSEGPSFDTIVGSGINGALPHYNAGQKKIESGEFVVLDFGATYEGYCSDTTRTLAVGEPSEKMKEVYNIVKEAQELGVKTARPGIKAKEVDKAVRNYIEEKGYGEYFTHRTGHGLGLQVHEDPYISGVSEIVLETGMVFSIEPGIYLEGEFGVRIEDIVVVTEDGCERFNKTSKELTII